MLCHPHQSTDHFVIYFKERNKGRIKVVYTPPNGQPGESTSGHGKQTALMSEIKENFIKFFLIVFFSFAAFLFFFIKEEERPWELGCGVGSFKHTSHY